MIAYFLFIVSAAFLYSSDQSIYSTTKMFDGGKNLYCSASHCSGDEISRDFLHQIKNLENRSSHQFYITSGFRCGRCNSALSNSSAKSKHLTGMAVDIRYKSRSQLLEVKRLAKNSNYFTAVYDECWNGVRHIHLEKSTNQSFSFRKIGNCQGYPNGPTRSTFPNLFAIFGYETYNTSSIGLFKYFRGYKNNNFSKLNVVDLSIYYYSNNRVEDRFSFILFSEFRREDINSKYQSFLAIGEPYFFYGLNRPLFEGGEGSIVNIRGSLNFHWLAFQDNISAISYNPGIEAVVSFDSYFSGLEISYLKTFIGNQHFRELVTVNYYFGLSAGFVYKK